MNKVSSITAAITGTIGVLFQSQVLPQKWAGLAMALAVAMQAFMGAVQKPPDKTVTSATTVARTVETHE